MAGERRGGTIRLRVTLLATVAVAIVLVVTSILLVARQRAAFIEQLDDALERDAARVAAAFASGDGVADGTLGDDDVGILVVTDDGRELVRSAGYDDVDGDRVASQAFVAPDGTQGVVFAASSLEDVDENVGALIASLAWIVPLAIAALAGIVWIVVGRTLRPVEAIRAQVAAIGMQQLDRRVSEPPGHDEISRLAATMNEMLERLERSSIRQQRFVADASHELRTPLTRMRAELEAGTATPASLLEELEAQQRMIEDLLVLARADAGALDSGRGPVDLDDLVLEEVRARRAIGATIDATAVSAAQVAGNADQLRRVVRNLIDNAVRHATSTVKIGLVERDGQAVLTVSDDGPGIPPERRAELFERFTRLDDARSGGGGRTGLGLAIAHDLVASHGGEIVVEGGPGARFVVTLPIGHR